MKRKEARDEALKLIYQLDIQKTSADEVLELYMQLNPIAGKSAEYISFVVTGVYNNIAGLDAQINTNLKGWAPDRISKISRAALRLALFEMNNCEDVPISVAINEAVELSKKYEDDDSSTFVNGILGNIARSEGK